MTVKKAHPRGKCSARYIGYVCALNTSEPKISLRTHSLVTFLSGLLCIHDSSDHLSTGSLSKANENLGAMIKKKKWKRCIWMKWISVLNIAVYIISGFFSRTLRTGSQIFKWGSCTVEFDVKSKNAPAQNCSFFNFPAVLNSWLREQVWYQRKLIEGNGDNTSSQDLHW